MTFNLLFIEFLPSLIQFSTNRLIKAALFNSTNYISIRICGEEFNSNQSLKLVFPSTMSNCVVYIQYFRVLKFH